MTENSNGADTTKKRSSRPNPSKKIDALQKFWEEENKKFTLPNRVPTELTLDKKLITELQLFEKFYRTGLKKEFITKDMIIEDILNKALENNKFFTAWKGTLQNSENPNTNQNPGNEELNLIDDEDSVLNNLGAGRKMTV